MCHGILDKLGSAVLERLPGQKVPLCVFRQCQADLSVLIYFQECGSSPVHAVPHTRFVGIVRMQHCRVVQFVAFHYINSVITHAGCTEGHIQRCLVLGKLHVLVNIVHVDVTAILYRPLGVCRMDCAGAGIPVIPVGNHGILPCLVNCRGDHACVIHGHVFLVVCAPHRGGQLAVLQVQGSFQLPWCYLGHHAVL